MTRQQRQVGQIIIIAALLGVTTAAGWLHMYQARVRSETAEMLHSADADTRKQAAWRLIDEPAPDLNGELAAGILGGEAQPLVREAYIYALGHVGTPDCMPAIEHALRAEESGYVRCAAWVAAARLAPDRFRVLAAEPCSTPEVWDQIGIATGRLSLGDTRGVQVLLTYAVSRDEVQRRYCSRALYKGLRPLLDAAGRWPIEEQVGPEEIWPPELVETMAERCARSGLQEMADQTRRSIKQYAELHRAVARLYSVRQRLAKLLFGE